MDSSIMSNDRKNNSSSLPVGVILPYAGDIPPEGFLMCNGCSISRNLYSNLFNVIGTKFGAENSDFFNLPNLVDRFIEGASQNNKVGTYISPSLPNIKGTVSSYMHYSTDSNLFQISRGKGDNWANTSPGGHPNDTAFTFNANKYNGIYKDECKTVQPNALCLNYIIKY